MSPWYATLATRGILRLDEPLARHCTWRVGGAAAIYFEPSDREDLVNFVSAMPAAVPLTWLGLGSNVLIREGGIAGVVLLTGRALAKISPQQNVFKVEAGVPCAKVAKQVASAGYTGAEFLSGIPGSIGGALAMNAGAFGSEIWSRVCAVETIDRAGRCRHRTPADYEIGYRSVRGPSEEWFLAGELVFQSAPEVAPKLRVRELLAQRNASQPTGAPSGGSVFRNPPGDYAGRLIEAAGFKGYRVGGCHVSPKHANFIINDGQATATEIESLIEQLRAAVWEKFGILLELEVRILGRAVNPPARGPGA